MGFMIGGAIGAVLRFAIYEWLRTKTKFFMPTVIVNVAGSLLLGLYIQLSNGHLYEFFVIGCLSSFTTFSTFSVDNIKLLLEGRIKHCIYYTVSNVLLCTIAIIIGLNI